MPARAFPAALPGATAPPPGRRCIRPAATQAQPQEQCRGYSAAKRERGLWVPDRHDSGTNQPEVARENPERHCGVIAVRGEGALIEMPLVRAPDGLAPSDPQQQGEAG